MKIHEIFAISILTLFYWLAITGNLLLFFYFFRDILLFMVYRSDLSLKGQWI